MVDELLKTWCDELCRVYATFCGSSSSLVDYVNLMFDGRPCMCLVVNRNIIFPNVYVECTTHTELELGANVRVMLCLIQPETNTMMGDGKMSLTSFKGDELLFRS